MSKGRVILNEAAGERRFLRVARQKVGVRLRWRVRFDAVDRVFSPSGGGMVARALRVAVGGIDAPGELRGVTAEVCARGVLLRAARKGFRRGGAIELSNSEATALAEALEAAAADEDGR